MNSPKLILNPEDLKKDKLGSGYITLVWIREQVHERQNPLQLNLTRSLSVLCFIYNLIDNIPNFWTKYVYEIIRLPPFYSTRSLLYETALWPKLWLQEQTRAQTKKLLCICPWQLIHQKKCCQHCMLYGMCKATLPFPGHDLSSSIIQSGFFPSCPVPSVGLRTKASNSIKCGLKELLKLLGTKQGLSTDSSQSFPWE